MSRAPRLWTLPGPSTFVRSVAEIATNDGIVAIIAPPHCPPQLDAALEAALHQPWLPALDARSDEPPLAALSRAFEADVRSAAALPVDRAAEGKAVVVHDLDAGSWPRWETTLRAWATGCARRPRFGAILVAIVGPACESAIKSVGLRSLPWRDVIGSRDAMLWALDRVPSTLDPLFGRLAVETAMALAGWDLDTVAQFAESFAASPRRMFDVPPSRADGVLTACWAEGTTDLLDGVAFPLLTCCGQEEVSRRVWRAQATVLFGWLETERSGFVRRHHRMLRNRVDRARAPDVDLSTLEWAEIARLSKAAFAAGDRRIPLAEEARTARNALAHLEPIDYSHFARVLSLTRADRNNGGDVVRD